MITVSTSAVKKAAYHHGDLREALITAALDILGEGVDPAALSLREAARRAGVSAMAPYRHFADKEALLAAVAMRGFERLAAAQAEATRLAEATRQADPNGADPCEAIVGQGVAYVRFACAEPALFRLMFGDAAIARRGELAEVAGRSYRALVDAVAQFVPAERTELTVTHCWALAHGLAQLAVNGQLDLEGRSPSVLAEQVLRAAFPRQER